MQIQEMVDNFQRDRPSMNGINTPEHLIQLLRAEVDEFDIDRTPDELADIVIFALTIAGKMGLDMEAEVRKKVAYNHARFPASDFQLGSYEEARAKGKEREKEVKHLFYDAPTSPEGGEKL